jgi:hypothetical protein
MGPEIMRAEPPYLRGQAGASVLLVAVRVWVICAPE